MFRKLQLQLTALCIAITALVLAVLSCICLSVSESGTRRQEYSSFLADLDTLYRNLEQQTVLSHTLMRQMEQNYRFFVRITDNGIPLFYDALAGDDLLEELWKTAAAAARDEHGLDLAHPNTRSVLTQHEEFSLTYAGERYNVSAAVIPHGSGRIGATVLQPLTHFRERMIRQRVLFVLADLAALMLLGIFYFCFTARMIRPLRENRKKQMQFVASASHELRSPLTVILSNVAAVKRGVMPQDTRFLDTVELEAARMSRLITDMLQLAGADNRTWSLSPAEVEPDTLLLQVWESFEPLAQARGLRWDISLPEKPVPHCVCDGERIQQLLSILIDNAFSYTPRGGCVTLSLLNSPPDFLPAKGRTAYRGSLYITVSDNGPGIPDDQKEAVFERFQRLDRSRTDKSHFGLGLCIAQEIAHLHRGRILLSDTPGGGATFTVVLPGGQHG